MAEIGISRSYLSHIKNNLLSQRQSKQRKREAERKLLKDEGHTKGHLEVVVSSLRLLV
jgi:hypothetical protein